MMFSLLHLRPNRPAIEPVGAVGPKPLCKFRGITSQSQYLADSGDDTRANLHLSCFVQLELHQQV
jgi:hypothetical protein